MSALVASLSGDLLRRPSSSPDLESGFALHLLRAAGRALPDAYTGAPRPADPIMLRRTPELAAFGYFLPVLPNGELHAMWIAAFGRLRHRDVFPTDRNSFFFNPLELLGIAVGAAASSASGESEDKWLAAQLGRGWADALVGDLRARLLAMRASGLVGAVLPQAARTALLPADLSTLPTGEVLMAASLAAVSGSDPLGDLLGTRLASLEDLALRRVLNEPIPLSDAAEAAIAYISVERLVERALALPDAADASARVEALFRRFQLFAEGLRTRQRGRPGSEISDEYDVQDALHAILRLHFSDVRPEEYTPSYAGNAPKIDFYLPHERTMVEAKMTRRNLGQREVADELIIDKERYSRFPDVGSLICLVCDPSRHCQNPAALEADLRHRGFPPERHRRRVPVGALSAVANGAGRGCPSVPPAVRRKPNRNRCHHGRRKAQPEPGRLA